MRKKIFRSIILAALAVLAASLIIILGCMYDYFGTVYDNQMKDELDIAAAGVENGGIGCLAKLDSERYRLTWIESDGQVIYDTETGTEQVENHGDRPEVIQALETGEGSSSRYSTTLLQKTIYRAKKLDDGSVLRISMSRATAGIVLLGMVQPILLVVIVALVLAWIFAGRLSKRIVEPLNELDLDHPLENDAYEELSPLLGRINHQHSQIKDQIHSLRRKSDEFSQTIKNMKEGLVLLDDKRTVISINPAAKEIFSSVEDCVGKDFLTIDRSRDIGNAVTRALEDGHSEIRGERKGRIFQFDITAIKSEDRIIGAVILAFDITEQENAERNRREFTANVSHELKTPLQGIIGSAELIENGMVKPEDMPRFVGHIRSEASRLVTLIDDIIRLSQLDEGEPLPEEDVDLLDIAEEVVKDLTESAKAKNVTMLLEGDPIRIHAVRRLIFEIVYNLCDNGIKYNKENGTLRVTTGADDQWAVLTVEDTGIGIPVEHRERVFERFYRVDKSHSKASGGTGLGLSIVKHAVQYHHGKISLSSEPGTGTKITVLFPLK